VRHSGKNCHNAPNGGGHARNRRLVNSRLAVLSLLALVSIVASQVWQTSPRASPELFYQGKHLSAWLDPAEYHEGGVDPEAERAVRQIGTNAIPFLLKLAAARDSPLKARVCARVPDGWLDSSVGRLERHAMSLEAGNHEIVLPGEWFASYVRRSFHNHFSAAFGFEALGPAAKPAVPALIKLLDDGDDDIRETAAKGLRSIGPEAQDAISSLINHLTDPDVYVCQASAAALENIPPKSAEEVPKLLRVLSAPSNAEYVTACVIDRLARFGGQAKAAVPAILPFLHHDFISMRSSAADALGQIDPEAAKKALLNALDDADENIRMTAADGLGAMGPEAQDAIPALIQRLDDQDECVRAASAKALEKIPPKSVDEVPALQRVLSAPPDDPFVIARVIDRLAKFQTRAEAAVPAILPYLRGGDVKARESAAKALIQIDPEAAKRARVE
jgi:HEAT repeat protein